MLHINDWAVNISYFLLTVWCKKPISVSEAPLKEWARQESRLLCAVFAVECCWQLSRVQSVSRVSSVNRLTFNRRQCSSKRSPGVKDYTSSALHTSCRIWLVLHHISLPYLRRYLCPLSFKTSLTFCKPAPWCASSTAPHRPAPRCLQTVQTH